jgi:hypothetical protein
MHLLKILKLVPAIALACCVTEAGATIVSQADAKFGAGALTYDSATKLQWLDLTITTNKSYAYVSSQFGAGGAYEGFRYASLAELNKLETDFGFTLLNSSTAVVGNGIPAYNFINMLGNTRPSTNGTSNPYTDGLILNAEVMVVGGVCSDGNCNGSANDMGHDFSRGIYSTSSASTSVGSFLVRSAAVPEPGSIALFGIALTALAAVRRKRSKSGG